MRVAHAQSQTLLKHTRLGLQQTCLPLQYTCIARLTIAVHIMAVHLSSVLPLQYTFWQWSLRGKCSTRPLPANSMASQSKLPIQTAASSWDVMATEVPM